VVANEKARDDGTRGNDVPTRGTKEFAGDSTPGSEHRMNGRSSRRTHVQRLVALVVAAVSGCAAPRPPASAAPPVPPPVPPPAAERAPMRPTFEGRRAVKKPLEVATDRLLAAIEEETGVRPAGDGEPGEVSTRPRRVARGWGPERSELAHELIRSVDAREVGVRAVRRALAALEWDRLVGGRWPEVDQVLVSEAVRRATEALPKAPVEVPDAEARVLLAWPVVGSRVTSGFGLRSDPLEPGTQFHAGVDLSAIEGQLVYAAAAGRVDFAGRRGGYGLHVELSHPGGLVTRYAHLDALVVSKGQRVTQGEPIAYAGKTGRATGPHLHFELWRDGRPLDPTTELPEAPGLSVR